MEFGQLYVILKGYKYVLFKMLIYYRREKALMPKAGDRFIVEIKPSHLGWGTHRYTDTRDPIYGEGYMMNRKLKYLDMLSALKSVE